MVYEGAEALRLEGAQARSARPYGAPVAAPSFEVYEGGGLDARARQGVDSTFISRVRMVAIVVLAVVIVGAFRVALSAATVNSLQASLGLRSKVESLQNMNAELEIERSVESSSQRIIAIATQNYGMVYASDVDTIKLDHKSTDTSSAISEASSKVES